ncbi:MAG: NUDIX hydrolase [Euzebya sp.]
MSALAPRMDSAFRDLVRDRLASFEVLPEPDTGLRRAAVCVALTGRSDEPAELVLCRRGRVGSHRNQWGLPGGRVDTGETPQQAALRELTEEVDLDGSDVLGRLDDYVTRSGYHLTPFVVWCVDQSPRVASPAEIHSVNRAPLAELLRSDSPRWLVIPESDREVLQLPIGDHLIHAPTAAVMYQFAEVVLHDRHTRVSMVEEPVFAWR